MRTAESLDRRDGIFACLDETDCLLLAEQALEREEFCRPAQHASAVSTARSGAADIRFHDDDVEIRLHALEVDCRPQAGETAADDAHLGMRLALQRRRWMGIALQGLIQPEWSHVASPELA
jgi:hypothetical protein